MERDLIGRPKTESLCLVCGDKASGRHYGVPSCDGCRGFFKRSIRRNLDYVCKESNQCIVDVSRRNQCQACRFRRCLEMNMKREAVQHERAPRGSFKRVFPPEFAPPMSSAPPLVPSNGPTLSHFYAGSLPFPWRPHFSAILQPPRQLNVNLLAPHFGSISVATAVPQEDLLTAQLKSAESAHHPLVVTDDEVSSSANEEPTVIKIDTDQVKDSGRIGSRHDHLTAGNPPARSSPVKMSLGVRTVPAIPAHDPTLHLNSSMGTAATERDSHAPSDLNESAARLLFLAVRWARAIPSFSQLSCHDQNLLLEDTWCELFILTIAQWNFNLDEVNLSRHCPDDRREFWSNGLQQLRQLVTRIVAVRMDHTEYACLKALVLFKPESRGLRDPLSVEVLQDQTQMMLHEYCISHVGGMTAISIHQRHPFPGRFGKLLLLLPPLRAVAQDLVVDVFFRQIIGDTPIGRLLVDLMAAV